MNELPREMESLRRMLSDVARERRIPLYATALPFGFELLPQAENWDYHCTPVNGVTFGATGGDGIHLNVLTTGPAAGAVVLTAPPSDTPNTVLGESFHEFLRLGYYGCFAWLEVLAFDPDAGDTEYRESPGLGELARLLRGRLRETFSLQPITNVTEHIAGLQRRFLHEVVLPDRAEWDARNSGS
jgi:hypothetical protein